MEVSGGRQATPREAEWLKGEADKGSLGPLTDRPQPYIGEAALSRTGPSHIHTGLVDADIAMHTVVATGPLEEACKCWLNK